MTFKKDLTTFNITLGTALGIAGLASALVLGINGNKEPVYETTPCAKYNQTVRPVDGRPGYYALDFTILPNEDSPISEQRTLHATEQILDEYFSERPYTGVQLNTRTQNSMTEIVGISSCQTPTQSE